MPAARSCLVPRSLTVACGLSVALLGAAEKASASTGFMLYEQSAEALGRAGAVAAATREPAAAWFNPAALGFAPPAGASVGAALILGRARFIPAAGGEEAATRVAPRPVPNLYAYTSLTPRVRIAVALLAPFGLALRWPDGWRGETKSLATQLRFIEFNPSLVFRLRDRLSIAAGFAVVRGDVELEQALPKEVGGRGVLSGGGWGTGMGGSLPLPMWNAALHWRPLPDTLHFAATFRSRVQVKLAGQATFSPEAAAWTVVYPDQAVSSQITLPGMATLGAMLRVSRQLEVSAECNLTLWNTFDRIVIDFSGNTPPDQIIERHSRNAVTARLGGAWNLADLPLVLRAGAFFAQNTTPPATQHPVAPDGDRVGLGAGIGYSVGRLGVDVGYLYLHFLDATAAPTTSDGLSGVFRTRMHALALTVTVR